jgi:hypothetical protein
VVEFLFLVSFVSISKVAWHRDLTKKKKNPLDSVISFNWWKQSKLLN